MKFRKFLFWSCMLIFFGAGAKSEMPSSNGQRVILTQEKSNKNRPKAPSRVWVECTSDDGRIFIGIIEF